MPVGTALVLLASSGTAWRICRLATGEVSAGSRPMETPCWLKGLVGMGLPLLLNQAVPLTLVSRSLNLGKKAKRYSPLVCTGPSKLVRLVNQIGEPAGVMCTCVKRANWAKVCRRTRTLKSREKVMRRRARGGTCPSLVIVYV